MAYIKREKTFTKDGRPFRYFEQTIDEPETGVTTGTEHELMDTPSTNTSAVYSGGPIAGSAPASVEISLDDGATWLDLADGDVVVGGTAGVPHSVMVRPTLGPMDGETNRRLSVTLGAVERGQAGYAD